MINAIRTINFAVIFTKMSRRAEMRAAVIFLLALRGRRYWEISPRMSDRSTNRFNQREVARALRAARLAANAPSASRSIR